MEKGSNKKYLTLAELAKGGFFSLEYLQSAVKSRKLKAFKAGEDWFTTQNWFSDFKNELKQTIQAETGNSSRGVRLLPERYFFWARFWRFFAPALIASFLSTAVLAGVWFSLPKTVRTQVLSLSEKAVSWGRVAGIAEKNGSLPKNGF